MEIAMVDERHVRQAMARTVLPATGTCAHEGYMEPAHEDWAGRPLPRLRRLGRLHYVCYDVDEFHRLGIPGASRENHGAVVFSHGFSEFAAKYGELVWYFLLAGFSVCVLEHRGHGYSARDVEDDQIVYIDDWRRYVADLAKFTKEVGGAYARGGRPTLFAHSMGAGIAAAMLERCPNIVARAVLSSPMIKANTGAPNWLAAAVCGAACDLGRAKSMAPGQHGFTPVIDWRDEQGACAGRLEWYKELRIADTHYRTTAAANEWVRQAVRISRAILDPDMCERIDVPVLLFQSGHDHWVSNPAQDAFVQRVGRDGGRISKVRIEDSVHEIFSMPNAVVAPYLQRIFRWLQSEETVTVLP